MIARRTGLRSAATAVFLLAASVAGLWALDRAMPPDLTRATRQALLLNDADAHLLDGRTSADGDWRLTTHRDAVDPRYVALLLRTEDRRFWRHPGVDPLALIRAAGQIVLHGHIVSGGSTLAMQTARLLTPHRHSFRGKIEDILRALQLEYRFGRAGVLDLYLTLTPEGGNIEGVRAAALLYFGHTPARLTRAEATLLVALPRRPEALRPDRHPDRLAATLRAMQIASPPAFRRGSVPHFAPALLGHAWARHLSGEIATTLGGDLQQAVNRVLSETPPPPSGTWAAMMVRPNGRIAAWTTHGGKQCSGCAVDMVTAWRSPGSTLKPFIYALAFQYGLLNAASALPDQPTGFDGYAPRDYDRMFHGATSVRVALQQSYNLPAVEALRALGVPRFVSTLAANGVALRLPGGDSGVGPPAGLAIALGGVGVRMLDLARLYHALSAGGVSTELAWRAEGPAKAKPAQRLVDRPAADAVVSILRGTPPPSGVASWGDRAVAYKTGTSYGHRDAWAAGIAQGWTVIVWGGRPDGTPSPGSTGRQTAAPMLAALLDLLALRRRQGAGDDTIGVTPDLASFQVAAPTGLQIVAPVSGSTIESFDEDGRHPTPIGLEASGGTPPYRWMVDGHPLVIGIGATPVWTPEGPGFAHLAVIDAAGHAAGVHIRVR